MIKVFYHSSDPDGWCSAAILKQEYLTADFYPINYGEKFPWEDIDVRDEVWMVDFSLEPFEDMIKLKSCCSKFIWIDHHISAIDSYKKHNPYIHIDGIQKVGRGACQWVWQYVHKDPINAPIPLAVELIASYDVWDHSDPRTVPFVYGIRSFTDTSPHNTLLWNTLLSFPEDKIQKKIRSIIDRGKVVLDFLDAEYTNYTQAYCFDTEIEGYSALACNRGISGKRLFNSVWDDNKYDIAITFCRLPSKKWTVSLYSDKPNVDVSKIAVKYGGGGHKGAAGMQVDDLPFYY